MDRNPQKFSPHTIKQQYCTVLLLYYNSKQTYLIIGQQVLSKFLVPYASLN